MKGCTELAIGFVLLTLMYEKPYFLTEFSNSILGKAVMIIGVGLIAKTSGLVSGLLSALVMLILMHNTKEGLLLKDDKDDKLKEGFSGVAFQAAPVHGSDIRMIDGRQKRSACENTISAMKQCNGHTCKKSSAQN